MFRILIGATAVALLSGAAASQASAVDLPGCVPHRHHRHVAKRHGQPQLVYGRATPRPYNYEDNGRYDGADLPPPGGRYGVGQGPSWLDGYGTRPVAYPGYGVSDTYGGSAQVWPRAISPGGGLAVYIPGAYGPGPRIVRVPDGY